MEYYTATQQMENCMQGNGWIFFFKYWTEEGSYKRINDKLFHLYKVSWDFPGGAVVKNLPANAGVTALSPGPGRSHIPHAAERHNYWACTAEINKNK